MNILAMAIASTFNSQRKYLRWHLKVLAFFTGVIDTWMADDSGTKPEKTRVFGGFAPN